MKDVDNLKSGSIIGGQVNVSEVFFFIIDGYQ